MGKIIFSSFVCFFVFMPGVDGSVIYVDGSALGSNDGTGWVDGFVDLQDGLGYAGSHPEVEEIRVGQGTYRPAGMDGAVSATFQLLDGLAVVGGYGGSGHVDPDERNVNMYETILSGDLNGDDGEGFSNRGDNSLYVVDGNGTGAGTLLDGFTITGATSGGMRYGSLTVSNSTISYNLGSYGAGARVYAGMDPVFNNCLFIGNDVTSNSRSHGGAIFVYGGGSITLRGCSFVGNSASEWGGGLYSVTSNGSVNIVDCIFWGNNAGALNVETNQIYGSQIFVDSSCVQGWTGGLTGTGFGDVPLFVSGVFGDHYLSQISAGQGADSPCVDAGSDTSANLGMDIYSTSTDHGPDVGVVDLGYHYDHIEVPVADLDSSGVVDLADARILFSQWQGEPGVPSADIAPGGGDNFVDGQDFLVLIENWMWP